MDWIEKYLEEWKKEDGIFIFKLKWLLQWYKEVEKNSECQICCLAFRVFFIKLRS